MKNSKGSNIVYTRTPEYEIWKVSLRKICSERGGGGGIFRGGGGIQIYQNRVVSRFPEMLEGGSDLTGAKPKKYPLYDFLMPLCKLCIWLLSKSK